LAELKSFFIRWTCFSIARILIVAGLVLILHGPSAFAWANSGGQVLLHGPSQACDPGDRSTRAGDRSTRETYDVRVALQTNSKDNTSYMS
jgi:hypothetical protein